MLSHDARIAVLESEMRDVKKELHAANTKLDAIMESLSQMTGGKRAVFGLFAIIGGFIGAVAAVVAIAASIINRVPSAGP